MPFFSWIECRTFFTKYQTRVGYFATDGLFCTICVSYLFFCYLCLIIIVTKCSFNNGGCDASAVCTDPTTVGGEVTCSCAAGFQFDLKNTVCTSIAEADRRCPSSTCWTYEMNDESGEEECTLKLRGFNK